MTRRIRTKYIRPTSLTWLASATPLGLGLFMAFEPVHHLTDAAQAVSNLTGHTSPYDLINMGLVGIGIRGALE